MEDPMKVAEEAAQNAAAMSLRMAEVMARVLSGLARADRVGWDELDRLLAATIMAQPQSSLDRTQNALLAAVRQILQTDRPPEGRA